MGKEIERKYLVCGDAWRKGLRGIRYSQSYIPSDHAVVRVRVCDDHAMLTIKGELDGIARTEYEYPIPPVDAYEMLEKFCTQPYINKTRYHLDYAGKAWVIDEFHGANQGLIVAEIELEAVDQPVEKPPWAGEDVSEDPRYFNFNLATRPYTCWD